MTRRCNHPWKSAAALALLVAIAGCRRTSSASVPDAAVSAAPVELKSFDFGGDFTLTNQTGAVRHLSDFRGRVVLLFFGYTSCPDACPLAMSRIATALHTIPESSDDVRTLFISVDRERDTPAVLADYVQSFDVPLEGLTGTRQQIDDVVHAYRAAYEIVPADSQHPTEEVSHTTYIYLLNRAGRLRYIFRGTAAPDTSAAGVRAALD
jgi:protein SCO1/2